MSYHGDIRLGDTIDVKFTTRRFSSGAPYTLAGTPSVAAYVGNGTTEITAGITLSVDFDGRTGLNNVRVVATSGNGFATASNVQLVITAGTVDSVSVVGEVVGEFSIENRSAVMPTTAGRTLDVSAGGEAGVDWANVGSPTTTLNLSATTIKTATDVETDTADIQTRLPPALVSGRMDSSVGAMAANTLTAAATAADYITEVQTAITGGAYDLDTDANGRIRIVDGTGAGEIDTTSGGVLVAALAANSITAAASAADFVTEVQSGLATAASIAALNNLSAAQVNAEVVDALSTDTYAEPGQGAPGTTISLAAKINWLYASWRNLKTNDGTTTKLYADDGTTIIAKQTTGVSGGTVSKAEWITGA